VAEAAAVTAAVAVVAAVLIFLDAVAAMLASAGALILFDALGVAVDPRMGFLQWACRHHSSSIFST
jgi:hypothetical protein